MRRRPIPPPRGGGAKKSHHRAPPKKIPPASTTRAAEKDLQKHKAMLAAANRLLQKEIAKRHEAEVSLLESEARFTSATGALQREGAWLRALIEATQDAVITINRERRVVFFNPAAERIFGYSHEEIVGQKVNTLMAQPCAREHDSYIEHYEKTGEARAIGQIRTVEARRKNGDTFPIELSVTKVTVDDGDVRYAALIRDISDLKRSEAWLSTLIETAQDAVISIDGTARVVLFNPAAERMFGYEKAEILNQKVNVLMAEPYATEHDGYIDRYEKTGEAHAIGRIRTVVARRKDDSTFPIELSVTEVPTPEGVRYSAFIRDISEKTKLQQQLIDNERMAAIGVTAAKLGHEVANPLNGMSVTIQMLERRLKKLAVEDETLNSGLRNVENEIRRLNQLLNEYRMFYRRQKYDFEPVSLFNLLMEVLDLERSKYETSGIIIENNVPADLPYINVDVEKLRQVLLNLLRNAAEAMPQGGSITLSARAEADQIVLEIKDTGIGIPVGVDVFEPFTTTKSTGTGLGLVIVRQILTAHGATISYSSEPGKGTRFYLKFPAKLPALGEMA